MKNDFTTEINKWLDGIRLFVRLAEVKEFLVSTSDTPFFLPPDVAEAVGVSQDPDTFDLEIVGNWDLRKVAKLKAVKVE